MALRYLICQIGKVRIAFDVQIIRYIDNYSIDAYVPTSSQKILGVRQIMGHAAVVININDKVLIDPKFIVFIKSSIGWIGVSVNHIHGLGNDCSDCLLITAQNVMQQIYGD